MKQRAWTNKGYRQSVTAGEKNQTLFSYKAETYCVYYHSEPRYCTTTNRHQSFTLAAILLDDCRDTFQALTFDHSTVI